MEKLGLCSYCGEIETSNWQFVPTLSTEGYRLAPVCKECISTWQEDCAEDHANACGG